MRTLEYNSYNPYISISYHWKSKVNLHSKWGFNPENDWAVIFVVLSDYFQGEQGTLISASIGILDAKSSVTGKTANESTGEELKMETWRQVCLVLGNVPTPDKMLMYSDASYDGKKWVVSDTGFMRDSAEMVLWSQDIFFKCMVDWFS